MNSTQQAKAIIFDFDGTLADSFDVFLEVITIIANHRAAFTAQEIQELRKHSIKEVVKMVGIKPWQVPLYLARGRKEIGARMDRIPIFPGVSQALKSLAQHYRVYILSTNSEANILRFLEKYNLAANITKIHGTIGLVGKARALAKLYKKEAITDCVYIGDESRDIEAAQKAGVKSIAVTWGYGDPTALRACAPDAVVALPSNLPKIISDLLDNTP